MSSTFIIAEVAQAHDGSLGILHSYIDAVSSVGVDAIKFQTHIADAESSIHEPFRVHFSYEDTRRMDYWRRMEFTFDQWKEIKQHCEDVGLEFMSSPFSIAAVELLENLGIKKYKIGSGEVNNLLLLDWIGSTGKDIILSSGMSSYDELDKTLSFLSAYDNKLSILQCTTSYPTMPEQWGLNTLTELQHRYAFPIGFSDHSGNIYACLAAVALGAKIVEFHVVFDKKMFGPDSKASIDLEQAKYLTEGIRDIELALHCPVDKTTSEPFLQMKQIFEKSLAVNKQLPAGHSLKKKDLETKKPAGKGIPANEYHKVIGRTLIRPMAQWEFLQYQDLANDP